MENVVVTVTFDELSNAHWTVWSNFCTKYGINEWCINEGADTNTHVQIALEDALNWGIVVEYNGEYFKKIKVEYVD